MNLFFLSNIFADEAMAKKNELPRIKVTHLYLYDTSSGKYFGHDFKLSPTKKIFTLSLHFNGNNYNVRLENHKGVELCTNLTEPCTIDKGFVVDKALNDSWQIVPLSGSKLYIVDRSNKCLRNSLGKDEDGKTPESFWGPCDGTTSPFISLEYVIGVHYLDEIEVKRAFDEMAAGQINFSDETPKDVEASKSHDEVERGPVVEEKIKPVHRNPPHHQTQPREEQPSYERDEPRNPHSSSHHTGNVQQAVDRTKGRELYKHLNEAKKHIKEASEEMNHTKSPTFDDQEYKKRMKEDQDEFKIKDLTKELTEDQKKVLQERRMGIPPPVTLGDSGGGNEPSSQPFVKGGFADLDISNLKQTPFSSDYSDSYEDRKHEKSKHKNSKPSWNLEIQDLAHKIDNLTNMIQRNKNPRGSG